MSWCRIQVRGAMSLMALVFAMQLVKTQSQAPSQICGCKRNTDVVFVVDATASNFQSLLEFVVSVVNWFDVGQSQTRVAVVSIGDTSGASTIYLNQFNDRNSLYAVIRGLPALSTANRDLTAAYQQVSTSVFTAGKGERSSAANWVFTVTTESVSNPTTAAGAASSLRQQFNSTMFSVGVGGSVAQSELVSYASSEAYTFSFDAADLINGFATQFVCTNLITTGDLINPLIINATTLLLLSGPTGVPGPPGGTGPAGATGLTGLVGNTGSTGPLGATGATGNRGPRGSPGRPGVAGPRGLPGQAGATGAFGPPGVTGPSGFPGPAGPLGTPGATGPRGAAGATGATGATGAAGSSGGAGATGVRGAIGMDGPAGMDGAVGFAGLTGFQGPVGATGRVGPRGSQGAQGSPGVSGLPGGQGSTGAVGSTGPQGATGLQGEAGSTGAPGSMGVVGPSGIAGLPGLRGRPGATGLQGLMGRDGATGFIGRVGSAGLMGATGPSGMPGSTGVTGPQGQSGIMGLAGHPGLTGWSGESGRSGASGAIGATGPTGATGASIPGPQGPPGLPGNSATNECLVNNGGCQQVCIDTPDSYYCACNPGFSITPVSKTCSANNTFCSYSLEAGGTICFCLNGTRYVPMNSTQCSDDNECSVNNGGCSQLCVNGYGSYKCCCNVGFTLSGDQHFCKDVNECNTTNKCPTSTVCVNTFGSYVCVSGVTGSNGNLTVTTILVGPETAALHSDDVLELSVDSSDSQAMVYGVLAVMGCVANFTVFVGAGAFLVRNRRKTDSYEVCDQDSEGECSTQS